MLDHPPIVRIAAALIWTLVAAVDVAGDLQPPPDPPRGERELWEL